MDRSWVAMTETTAVASFRRVTPAMIASARLAMTNDVPDIAKSEIALLLKKAAPILGIDGSTYHVMDILLGLSRAEDWKGAGRPIVAISNAKLAEYTMRSERTVIRCIRRLVEAGIAAYRDSSTGRRFVYRDEGGDITTGFGIDFTPARVRADELREAVAQYQRKLKIELEAKRDIARLSRAIEDICRAWPEETRHAAVELAGIHDADDDLLTRARDIRCLHHRLTTEVPVEIVPFDLPSEGDSGVTAYINTNPEPIDISMQTQAPAELPVQTPHQDRRGLKPAMERPEERRDLGSDGRANSVIQGNVLGSVSVGLLQAACPEAQAMIAVEFGSWAAVGRSGEMLRRMIGLSETDWATGKSKVGVYAASAILATVLEKSIRDPDQITRPNGYFRAMIERAMEGKLNLKRSLFGLAGQRYGRLAA